MRHRPSAIWRVTAAVIVATGIVAGAIWWLGEQSPRIDPNDAQQVSAGEVVYRAHCASCHGVNLEGQPDWRNRLPNGRLPAPPHDASGHTWHHPDDVLLQIVRDGPAFYASLGVQTDMPAFGNVLSEEEIAAVMTYIKSTWPPEIQARQARMNR
ncbi:c-type cytochrome [Dongia deserti]|uniref:c-type cytochrome n=1 Tax=Dongia deserti TaxID=2268030 RepID=UPI000E655442|nr:cytochrome c [Dongia deserti]